jgi:hypothetical protein
MGATAPGALGPEAIDDFWADRAANTGTVLDGILAEA